MTRNELKQLCDNAFSGLENLKTLIDNHLAEHKIQTRDSKKLEILHCRDEWQV